MSLTIITPTIGSKYLKKSIQSIINQTNQNFIYYIVIDGNKFSEKVNTILKDQKLPDNFKIMTLDENSGSNGWNGHRIYMAYSILTNSDYVMFLDEDNYLEVNHVESMIDLLKEKNLDWTFSLRNIINKDSKFICQDNCESLGNLHHVWNNKNDYLVDVNCYCIKRELFIRYNLDFYKKARPVIVDYSFDRSDNTGRSSARRPQNDIEVDRALYISLKKYKFESTKMHTVNYRVGNRSDSVQAEFFIRGNQVLNLKFDGKEMCGEKKLYIFHLDQNWTENSIMTNEFDYDSRRYLYEDGNKTMLYNLKKDYKLINGFRNYIPSGAICFFTIMDIRLLPIEVLERKDIKKVCYLLEGPNSWHGNNYIYENLYKFFDKIITYWKPLVGKEKIEYFPFVSRFDIDNKYHLEIVKDSTKLRKFDKSIGMILANRSNNEEYQINGTKLKRTDYLRREIVITLDNVTVHGTGWDSLADHKYLNVENVKNRMNDDTDIYQFYKRFNFALIVENCNAENYVSEKIYDAWIAGCIPIYYGNICEMSEISKEMYINVKDFKNFEEVRDFIGNMGPIDILKYYEAIDKNLDKLIDMVSPKKLCDKIKILLN